MVGSRGRTARLPTAYSNPRETGSRLLRNSTSRFQKTGAPGFCPGAPPALSCFAVTLTYGFKFSATPRDSFNERVDEIIHSRISVARRQRREMKPGFQKLQGRDGFVFGVINMTSARQRRDDDRRNANTGAPTICSHGRRDVVPAAAVLIVCDDNRACVPDIAM